MMSPNLTMDRLPPTPLETWGIGLFAVTIINSCAVVGIAIMPLLGKKSYHYLLTSLIGLGVGSLSGSALFHLLPEALQLDPDTKHEYIWKCWTAVAGIYLFFVVDKILKIILRFRKQRKYRLPKVTCMINPEKVPANEAFMVSNSNRSGGPPLKETKSSNAVAFSADAVAKKKEEEKEETEKRTEVSPVAWMVIFGDAIHNFVDGLSIGAAFTESVMAGVSVCVAVVCEEFPHEFGDIAILVSSGMKMRQALGYNLLSAATCYLGFGLGVVVGEMSEATVYIFALASGMFLYVALASMIPEMNETMERSMDVSMSSGLTILALQCIGIAFGLVIMFVLALYHHHISL